MPDHATNRRLLATRRYRTLRSGVFSRTNTLLDELSLHGIACEGERRSEVLARDFISPVVKFELAERGVEERVGGEAIAVGDGAHLFEPAFRAFVLRDGDGAVQRNDRGRTYRHQRVVKGNDFSPVSVLGAMGHRVNRCDCGLHVIFGQLGTRCRKIKEPLPLGYKP